MFIRFLLYLLKKAGHEELVTSSKVRQIAKYMYSTVMRMDAAPQSGEWKKHQVYAIGLKWFPEEPKRDISLAIELAVCKLGK